MEPEEPTILDHFKLSSVFSQHEQDIRSVCSFVENGKTIVCTTSRDRSVRLWNPISGQEIKVFYGHQGFVGSSVVIPASSNFPMQTVATGGNDKLIFIWDLESGNPFLTLIGHENSVVSLGITREGLLISGSWDKTARIWKGNQCVKILEGHENSVWAVLGLSNGDIATGSADHTIKIWRDGKCINTIRKHTDCVRGLSLVPGIGFVSCGNDGVAYLWSESGECLQELHGHNSFVYSVAVLPSGEFVTASEDRTLNIWKDGQCIQTIMHPGSVWCVTSLPNGDIVTGCSDSVARVWTRNPGNLAPQKVIEEYEKKLASQSLPSEGTIGDIQVDKLPGMEALNQPGKKDQEIKVVRNGNSAEAYQWNQSESRWIKVGEVVDARGSSKQSLNGKEYDYIFDVDIGDGQMRKLGYNNSENPYQVAQEFLWREELSNEFLEQVAQFIIKNSKPITLGEPITSSDPFTGGNRYIPTNSSYQSQSQSPQNFVFIPHKDPVLFESGNLQNIHKKILEFNSVLKQEGNPNAMNPTEEDILSKVVSILSEKSKYHASTFVDGQINLLFKLLQWPEEKRFPSI